MKVIRNLLRAIMPYGLIALRRKLKKDVGVTNEMSPTLEPPPPNCVPENLINEYTLNGKMSILYHYFDDRKFGEKRVHNTKDTYDKVFRELQEGTFSWYGKDWKYVLQAFDAYPIKGKNVLIWGLASCNCDAMAIYKGAKKVYVVDYNKPICDNEKIEVMNHEELRQKMPLVDFEISYSSFEHDGLGRYGDPLSPNGDFRAMEEAGKFLTDNGILILGVPLGKDCIVWNAHRIYGKYRLPLLLKGWQLEDAFFDNILCQDRGGVFNKKLGIYTQIPLVLKKINTDFPDDEFLLRKNENQIVCEINKMIYEAKKGF